ncbi:hydrophobic surface binding protein A-domain-containing protein [Xylariales sp. PMI_506]|nr:hydrophobic surface binding protein A-domain-containing protein [Xylariales sp. PMI_506]
MRFTQLILFGLLGMANAAPLRGASTHDRLLQLFAAKGTSVATRRASASLDKRTAAQIETDIASISSDLTTLGSQVTSFTGSIITGLELLITFDDLESDVEAATSVITSTGTLSAGDSATIYSDVSALTTKITTVLADVEAKASVVASSGYTSIVLSAVESLQTDAAKFFTALETYIDSSYTSEVVTLASTVAAAFTTAIADF